MCRATPRLAAKCALVLAMLLNKYLPVFIRTSCTAWISSVYATHLVIAGFGNFWAWRLINKFLIFFQLWFNSTGWSVKCHNFMQNSTHTIATCILSCIEHSPGFFPMLPTPETLMKWTSRTAMVHQWKITKILCSSCIYQQTNHQKERNQWWSETLRSSISKNTGRSFLINPFFVREASPGLRKEGFFGEPKWL